MSIQSRGTIRITPHCSGIANRPPPPAFSVTGVLVSCMTQTLTEGLDKIRIYILDTSALLGYLQYKIQTLLEFLVHNEEDGDIINLHHKA